MKSRVIYCCVMVGMLAVCMACSNLAAKKSNPRMHQHLTSSGQIPVVTVDTGGKKIPGAHSWRYEKNGRLDTRHADQDAEAVTGDMFLNDGKKQQKSKVTVRCRGNSSRWFDKKSYSIHLIGEEGSQNPMPLAGMAAHHEWVLNGPFLDKTMIRNYMCMNISGEIMQYAPNVRFCELVLNGQYQGLYLLMETITKGKGRLALSKPRRQQKAVDCVIHLERAEDSKREIDTYGYYTFQTGESVFEIRYPGSSLTTPSRKEYIAKKVSRLEKLLYSYDLKSGKAHYEDEIDCYEFAKYFVINEFFGNMDAGTYSTYYYKEVRGKWKPCVWDFNNACDNNMQYETGVRGFCLTSAPWYERLLKDKAFTDTVVNVYKRLRKRELSEAYLMNYIDETVSWIGGEVEKNYRKWEEVWNPADLDWYRREMNYLTPVERNPHSYEEAVRQLKVYLIRRGEWLDANIENLYQYCHESRNAMEKLR